MNYEDLVERIVTAEQKARASVETEEQRLSTLREDLAQESRSLTESYLERAKHRIAETERSEQQNADQEIQRVQAQFAKDMEQLEQRFATHETEYESAILRRVLGDWS